MLLTKPAAIFFDLDGTLIDSLGDLADASNEMLLQRSLPILNHSAYRPYIGQGAKGILSVSFPNEAKFQNDKFSLLCSEFYDLYEKRLNQQTSVFSGVDLVIKTLHNNAIPWGIVTNKHERFTLPLVKKTVVLNEAKTVICGDTTAHSKPHPLPLLEAAKRVGVDPSDCIFVGDDIRDIQAGKSAGMRTVAALYGFIKPDEDIELWQADLKIKSPKELLELLVLK